MDKEGQVMAVYVVNCSVSGYLLSARPGDTQ